MANLGMEYGMDLDEEQKKILEEMIDEKKRANKQKEENKAVQDGKEIEWYAALVNANFETRFELDRQLLTIASAAIGVLVSFMNDVDKLFLFILWLTSGLAFLSTIVLALNIFKNNKFLLEAIINGQETSLLDNSLKNKDIVMKCCFILGIITLFLVAILQLKIF